MTMVVLMSTFPFPEMPTYDERGVRLDQNWCPEGKGWNDVAADLEPECKESLSRALSTFAKPEEQRAALFLALLTGSVPENRDRPPLQEAVDIVLHKDGARHVAEVTASIDGFHMRRRGSTKKIEMHANESYSGHYAWRLFIESGWETPDSNAAAKRYGKNLARSLQSFEQGVDVVDLESRLFLNIGVEGITGRIELNEDPSIKFVSRPGDVPNSPGSRYLDRLNFYLANEPLIAQKLEKLTKEAHDLGAVERHLYLAMPATGKWGSLFPASPAYMNQGELHPPAGITDLWLDGRNDLIFHWSRQAGWTFHRATSSTSDPS